MPLVPSKLMELPIVGLLGRPSVARNKNLQIMFLNQTEAFIHSKARSLRYRGDS